ncbi:MULTISPECIES: acyl-CoA dehydratase activase [Clostridium]|uniref:Predicted (R)-2-hydroxyglutaryl-CoA dehydratase activator n=3 Tax=Clostridium TaxID=1485 RepID=D8GT16_CLOLD|nr:MULTISPECIES: acyl-CoA dehydratase activase [Clostridium]ADK16615.1 predicted (R)-2-hydroxyglutaryl-CoA dehydratase activator [Clostridium ljungdahlii DSM 13528]AGY75707.1 acyl-CoA dehydratase activase [Clostridium autoethanogenum DSM 10061]ALU35871.1 CoA-substrate-specific enzyme activase [Clostridium autoethanogenum DSM 10061]OAA89515.1 R-phenyllactate dehydratase activator [Clostridium ljungdahlii DSM 13528]OVY52070.1 R-phenyllactate dehydratase activator [Clostridium autoethanogenum]
MIYVGIDIGSTASKVCIYDSGIKETFALPTGWSSVKTAGVIKDRLKEIGLGKDNCKIVATGYGRVSVPYADKTITEITCHGKGAYYLLKDDCTVIDIGGQDTKIITIKGGRVTNFTMNDKCAAGTGRFLELMAGTLGFTIDELCEKAKSGNGVTISSMCTVFAESEITSLIGNGTRREDIAFGVVDSITSKVKSLCQKHGDEFNYFLTGGLSQNKYIINTLSKKLSSPVKNSKFGRYAGAIGAALLASKLK